jgi:hypothetical protein
MLKMQYALVLQNSRINLQTGQDLPRMRARCHSVNHGVKCTLSCKPSVIITVKCSMRSELGDKYLPTSSRLIACLSIWGG